jgi:hypothetical protein
LAALLFELGISLSSDLELNIPVSLAKLMSGSVPFLSPPNEGWTPDLLKQNFFNLGNLRRTRNEEQIDLAVLKYSSAFSQEQESDTQEESNLRLVPVLTGECKDFGANLKVNYDQRHYIQRPGGL